MVRLMQMPTLQPLPGVCTCGCGGTQCDDRALLWCLGYSTKLSSAGLVYKHFGRGVIASQLGQPEESPDVETVYLAVYKHFMEAIDGIDNGEGAGRRACPQPADCGSEGPV